MKILVIGDPHGTLPKKLTQIINKNKIEVIIVTGELPPVPMHVYYPKYIKDKNDVSYANKQYKVLLDKLCSFKVPVILLKGNAYVVPQGNAFTSKLFKRYKNLIYKRTGRVKIREQNFILFDMIWEKWSRRGHGKERACSIESRSNKRIQRLSKYLKETNDPILVSHAPPFGYLDKVPKVGHVGSKIILKIIKKYQPRYVLCGHIHEGKGKTKIGKSTVINAGSSGEYFLLDI
jgi:Icc-related predicted phosphoesterase